MGTQHAVLCSSNCINRLTVCGALAAGRTQCQELLCKLVGDTADIISFRHNTLLPVARGDIQLHQPDTDASCDRIKLSLKEVAVLAYMWNARCFLDTDEAEVHSLINNSLGSAGPDQTQEAHLDTVQTSRVQKVLQAAIKWKPGLALTKKLWDSLGVKQHGQCSCHIFSTIVSCIS